MKVKAICWIAHSSGIITNPKQGYEAYKLSNKANDQCGLGKPVYAKEWKNKKGYCDFFISQFRLLFSSHNFELYLIIETFFFCNS